MLYTAAMQSSPLLQTAGRTGTGLTSGHTAQEEAAEEGEAALGGLLLLKSPLGSSGQHPPSQGNGVRSGAF